MITNQISPMSKTASKTFIRIETPNRVREVVRLAKKMGHNVTTYVTTLSNEGVPYMYSCKDVPGELIFKAVRMGGEKHWGVTYSKAYYVEEAL